MLKIEVKKGNIEQALKSYKYKVNRTKQRQAINEKKEYTKPSTVNRRKIQKAKYIQKKSEDNS
jgi:small subunit ribosomal protein S21